MTAEAVGTTFLVMAVIGSGIAAQRLSPDDVGLQLLENSLVTGAALVALILAMQPVSASFNPVVTAVERTLGLITTREAVLSVAAQVGGGLVGCVLANLMFELDAVSVSGHHRASPGTLLGEVVATAGLVVIVFGSIRAGRVETVAFAVGGYISGGVLVHQLHELRQPGGHAGPDPLRHLCRHRTSLRAGVRPHAGGRRVRRTRPRQPAPPDSRSNLMTESNELQHRPAVLFVCVHNAGRSQMAAAYLNDLAGDRVEVLSAGSQPADEVNAAAVEVMAEEGIDIRGEQPKLLTDSAVQTADVVITMGCGDECPFYPGQALRGLGAGRPRRPGHRRRPSHP